MTPWDPQRRLLPCLALSAPNMVRSSPKRAKYLGRSKRLRCGPRVRGQKWWMNPDESSIYLGHLATFIHRTIKMMIHHEKKCSENSL